MRRHRQLGLAGAALGLLAVGAAVAARVDDDGGSATRSATTTTAAPTTTTLVGRPGAAGVGDPYFPSLGNGGYDVDHYTLDITWVPDDGTIAGITTIEATATQDLSRFDLDLAGLDVASVVVDGRPALVARAARELEITPDRAIASGRRFTTVVTYGGVPRPVSDGTDLFDVGWQTHGREAFVVSEPTGASTFFPVNDHPSDKASYTFRLTAPGDQVVAANGLLVGEPAASPVGRTWTYEARQPMASYLVQIAIGDYELVDAGTFGSVRVRHVLHRPVPAAAREAIARTASMIDVLDDVYGPFPFDAYGVLVVPQRLGFALETQTLTIVGADIAAAGRRAEIVLLHELSHQWVGDAASVATWKDIWLNEGFATYSEWLWAERTGGQSAARSARQAAGAAVDLDTPPGDPGTDELFKPTVYLRGAMTLQALREAIGDQPFFTLLRTWIDDHRGGNGSTPDLIALAERISGMQLDALFDRWLYQPGLPALG